MNEITLHSFVLAGLQYDPPPTRFQTGALYAYQMVPTTVVQSRIEARSQGEYFNSSIWAQSSLHSFILALMGYSPTR